MLYISKNYRYPLFYFVLTVDIFFIFVTARTNRASGGQQHAYHKTVVMPLKVFNCEDLRGTAPLTLRHKAD